MTICKLTRKKGLPASLAPSWETIAMVHYTAVTLTVYVARVSLLHYVDVRHTPDLLRSSITKGIQTGRDKR